MKRFLSGIALLGIAVGSAALVGCESYPNTGASADNSVNPAMAGGNGEFGENPVRPGAYTTEHEGVTPTTRPAAY